MKRATHVLRRYIAKDSWGMLAAWEQSPHPGPCLTELAVVAHLYAEAGSHKAQPLIDQLRCQLPNEAEALSGILAWRQRNLSEAARRLAAALRRLRNEPWILEHIRVKVFDAAIGVAKADPSQAAMLLHALAEPFAAGYADESRRATACVIAEELGPATVAQFVESFEPFVPWRKEFLTYRRQAYQNAGHRLAASAARDLQIYFYGIC